MRKAPTAISSPVLTPTDWEPLNPMCAHTAKQ